MADSFMRIKKGIQLIGETADAIDNIEGSLFVNSTTNRIRTYIQGSVREITLNDAVQTLTNKTISGATMTSVTSGAGTFTFNTTGTITVPNGTDTLVTLTGTQTLTNKTLTTPTIAIILNGGTLTLPTSTDTLVGRNTTDILTNKTLTLPAMSTINSGGFTLTLPVATDTLVGKATTDILTNKSISGLTNSITNIPAGTALTGQVPVANGGTGIASGTSGGILGFTASGTIASSALLTTGQLIIGGGAGATPTTLAAGAQFQSLVMGASVPGYSAVNLTQAAAVTGALGIANGGTSQTTANAGFNALSPMTTLGDTIYGGAAGIGTRLGIGTSGQVLTVSGGIPAWTTFAALTNPMTTGGDIIYGGAGGAPTRLANGTNGQFLTSSGGTSAPTWTTFTVTSPTVQRFTSSSATYTTPANVKYLRIKMVGGGGGGGGSGTFAPPSNGVTGTATLWKVAGGAAILTAAGGDGGFWAGAGSSGGAVTIGSPAVNFCSVVGGSGKATNLSGDTTTYLAGAVGGDSSFFGGGGCENGPGSLGSPGRTNTGGGGQGGGFNAGTAGNYSGSGGGSGGYIDAVIYTPSATYDYVVGGGGAGGPANGVGAPSSYAGGSGGSGIIIVEEFYV